MRKSATAPRRLYTISSHLVVLHSGKRFGILAEESAISAEHLVTVEVDGQSATVTQRRRGKKTVSETWKVVAV